MRGRIHSQPAGRAVPILAVVALTMLVIPLRVPPSAGASPHRYIVRADGASLDAVGATIRRDGGRVVSRLVSIGALVADLTPVRAAALVAAPGVASVAADRPVRLASGGYEPADDPYGLVNDAAAVGARAAWSAAVTGAGVDVALIDSGISPLAGLNTPGKIVDGPDLSFDSRNARLLHRDANGHGTHLAGIIAGRDREASPDEGFLGIAPNARLVNVKVADAFGAADVSQVIAGIDWVVQHAHDPGLNIRVLNLSFGTSSSQPYQVDPLAFAAETAWAHGIVVVVSAGNAGATAGRLTDPAVDPFVLAVGSADTQGTVSALDDTVAPYSSRGDGTRNPDLVAPGQHVPSLRVPGSFVDARYGNGPGSVSARLIRGSGTSQAAAVMSGGVALLLQQRPSLSPDQVKAVLTATATPLAGTRAIAAGSGLLNVSRALVTPAPAAVQPRAGGTGTGSLEGSRGSDLVLAGTALSGERDIFGNAVDTGQLARSESAAASWSGGVWNGAQWTSAGWQGGAWPVAPWTSPSWTGTAWSGLSWDDAVWTGLSWDAATWAGLSWDTSQWAGTSWDGLSWDVFGWA